MRDLRSVAKGGRPREQIEKHERPILRSFSFVKQSWDFFTF